MWAFCVALSSNSKIIENGPELEVTLVDQQEGVLRSAFTRSPLIVLKAIREMLGQYNAFLRSDYPFFRRRVPQRITSAGA